MSTPMIIMLIVLVVLIGVCVALYFFGKKAQKKQAEQQQQMDAVAQTISMLIIDKKKMKLKDAGLPAVVLENTPKYLRRSKVPVVKAKVGPKVMTLMCDAKVFEVLPVKKEAKVVVSVSISQALRVSAVVLIFLRKRRKKDFSQRKKNKNIKISSVKQFD